jgi:hypothetical protein
MLPGMTNSIALRRILSDVIGNQKSKMAFVIVTSQVLELIKSEFQRQYHVFQDGQLNVTTENVGKVFVIGW